MISGAQIFPARKLLGWSPSKLADRARNKMTTAAIKRAEAGQETALSAEQLFAIHRAFTSAGVEFTVRGEPVLIEPGSATPKIMLIIAGWAAAFGAKFSLQQKDREILLLA
jgi:hypothetical protein